MNQNPKADLLSGDDFSSPNVENSLALVPSEQPQSSIPTNQQNALVLADFYGQSNHTETSSDLQQAYQTEQVQTPSPGFQSFQSRQPTFSLYDDAVVSGSVQHEQSLHTNGTSATSDRNDPFLGQQLTQSSNGTFPSLWFGPQIVFLSVFHFAPSCHAF